MKVLNERNINYKKGLKSNKQNYKNQNFKGGLTGVAKAAEIFVKSQENLASTRFIQDTVTNWAPKAVFSRSKADFAEMSFLEFLESAIFYFASPLLGEKLFRNNLFKNFSPKNIQEKVNQQIPKSVEQITKNNALTDEVKKRAISTKAGIVLACAAIPIAEYTLSFAKNLFTLKTFKTSNFDNIANLDKSNTPKNEDISQQQRVEKNSKKQLKKAAIYSLAGVAAGSALALYGHKSNKLQSLSKAILEPGKSLNNLIEKVGINNEKTGKFLNGLSLDFAENNGKLALSKGQLALTAICGLFGYSKAAEDRGKLDVQEVWTRVPLVVFYTIFGAELFEKGFHKILEKKNAFPDLIKKGTDGKLNVPKLDELPKLAEQIAKTKKTDSVKELAKLTKQKAVITGVPYLFSMVAMGFALSAITRIWTQHRYNVKMKEQVNTPVGHQNIFNSQYSKVFEEFKL